MPKKDSRAHIRRRELLIHRQLEQAWTRSLARLGRDFPNRPMDLLDGRRERAAMRDAERHLQPWLRLFEEQIAWLASYYLLWQVEHDPVTAVPPADALPFELLATVVNHAAAVRRLVRSGLDYQARGMLRLMSETSHLALALLTHRTLRDGFMAAQEPDEARRFWRKELSTRRISAILTTLETELNIGGTACEELTEWRKSTHAWLSEFIHPTYLVALFGGYAWDPRQATLDLFRPNLLGRCSTASRTTLGQAYRVMWYFCGFFYSMACAGFRDAPRFAPDPKKDVESAMVVAGFDIILVSAERWWALDEEEGFSDVPSTP